MILFQKISYFKHDTFFENFKIIIGDVTSIIIH